MGFGDVVQQAIHAATVVPRLSAAAMKAGLGPGGAVEVLRISQAALQGRRGARDGRTGANQRDAPLHVAGRARRHGSASRRPSRSRWPRRPGTPTRRDSDVDQHNNAAGQAYGTAHVDELTAGSTSDAMAALVPVALEKWESDELVWVRPH